MNRWNRNTFRGAFAIAAALLLQVVPAAVRAAAPPELTGVWQGKLAVDASNSLAGCSSPSRRVRMVPIRRC